jgi:hypothetical protein
LAVVAGDVEESGHADEYGVSRALLGMLLFLFHAGRSRCAARRIRLVCVPLQHYAFDQSVLPIAALAILISGEGSGTFGVARPPARGVGAADADRDAPPRYLSAKSRRSAATDLRTRRRSRLSTLATRMS